MILGAAGLGALVVSAEIWALRATPAERRFCDQQVAVLLTSHDPMEVQRAGILVQAIPCDVARRIEARAP